MSMNVYLHPCISATEDFYSGETYFELSSWCTGILDEVVKNAKPIDKPIRIHWTANNFEARAVPGKELPRRLGSYKGDFDPDCVWVIEAWVLKCLKFHQDDWHPTRIVDSKAISAYLHELPDN